MPQMKPINWMMALIMYSYLIIFFTNILYFNKPLSLNTHKPKSTYNSMNWKW